MDLANADNRDTRLETDDVTIPPPPYSEDEGKKDTVSPAVDALDIAFCTPDFVKLAQGGFKLAGDTATVIGERLAKTGVDLMEAGETALEGLAETGGAVAENLDILDFLNL